MNIKENIEPAIDILLLQDIYPELESEVSKFVKEANCSNKSFRRFHISEQHSYPLLVSKLKQLGYEEIILLIEW